MAYFLTLIYKKTGLPVKGKPAECIFKKYNMALPQQRKVLPHQSHIDLKVFIVLFVSVQRKTFFLNAAIILKKITFAISYGRYLEGSFFCGYPYKSLVSAYLLTSFLLHLS